jgi:carboxymethylenebutenolidase
MHKIQGISKRVYGYTALILVIVLIGIVFFGVLRDSAMIEQTEEYPIKTEEVIYFENTSGYLAKPVENGAYPGVIMIHEWWGLTDHIRMMARKLAAEGYLVLAVDLYEGEVATTPERARELVSLLDQEAALNNMKSAVTYLKVQEGATKIASLGWCFGGGQSMQLAISGEILDATLIYYGNIVTDESQLSTIRWPVLGIFGDQDAVIPFTQVQEFEVILNTLGIENEIYIYPGVAHAFANPSGANYAPEETEDAWEKTVAFLNKYLK